MEAILHIMRDTILTFDNNTSRQIKGTAIGVSSSVAIAEIFVHVFFESQRTRYQGRPPIYYRYIDDIFGIMIGPPENLSAFHTWANSIHPNLRFTMEHNARDLSFLDTTISINTATRRLETKAYYKSTNLHTYLQYDSSHLLPLKNSFPTPCALD
ncbi:uncharacterized protein [Procambarus clarkii]|uniref:uncharacterized protein n=1 Tax=Procambarus clarkii TaxID=6728 RepID=UPI0037430AAC